MKSADLARLFASEAPKLIHRRGRLSRARVGGRPGAKRCSFAPDGLEARSSDLSTEEMIIECERFAFMIGVVLHLPEKERSALLMAKAMSLSHEEIGKRLGCSRHSVARYLSRALAACTGALEMFEPSGLADAARKGSDAGVKPLCSS